MGTKADAIRDAAIDSLTVASLQAEIKRLEAEVADLRGERRHPCVVAWDGWVRSPEGIHSLAGTAEGQYLRNRLQVAFNSGWDSCYRFLSLLAEYELRRKPKNKKRSEGG